MPPTDSAVSARPTKLATVRQQLSQARSEVERTGQVALAAKAASKKARKSYKEAKKLAQKARAKLKKLSRKSS